MGVGEGGDDAAEHKHQQPADNQRFATHSVGEQAKGDLEYCLRRAVDTDRQTDQRFAGTL